MKRDRIKSNRIHSSRGSTIALVLVFAVAIGIVIASALQRTVTETRLNRSAVLHNEARLATESVLQHGIAQLQRRYGRTTQLSLNSLLPNESPLFLSSHFYSQVNGPNGSGRILLPSAPYNPLQFAAQPTGLLGSVINADPIPVQVDNMSPLPDSSSILVRAQAREVILYAKATAEDQTLGRRTVYASKRFQVIDRSMFRYAVFYNHDMELWPGAAMDLGRGGPVHVNGDIYLGADSNLNIHSRVTATGKLYTRRHSEHANSGQVINGDIQMRNLHAGSDQSDYLVSLRNNAYTSESTAPVNKSLLSSDTKDYYNIAEDLLRGGLRTGEHGVPKEVPSGLEALSELFPQGASSHNNHAHNLIRPVLNENALTSGSLSAEQKEALQAIEDVKWANKAKLNIELTPGAERIVPVTDGDGNPVVDPITNQPVTTVVPDPVQVYTYEYAYNVISGEEKIQYDTDGHPIRIRIEVPSEYEFWDVQEFSQPGGAGSAVNSGLYDYRQAGNSPSSNAGRVNLLQLDIEKMRNWVESPDPDTFKSNWWNGVVYVKMPEQLDPGRADLVVPAQSTWATQLVNGKSIPNRLVDYDPIRGMTLATNSALYVQGDYNNPEHANGSSSSPDLNHFGKEGYEAPAALIADAITVLSNNWTNANSGTPNRDHRVASNTTVSAAFVTGLVQTADSQYSGGLENFPRFLEAWNGKSFVYRGSMISLFLSESHNAALHGQAYRPPDRNWSFHTGFLEHSPPGDPGIRSYRQMSYNELSMEEFQAATNAVLSGTSSP